RRQCFPLPVRPRQERTPSLQPHRPRCRLSAKSRRPPSRPTPRPWPPCHVLRAPPPSARVFPSPRVPCTAPDSVRPHPHPEPPPPPSSQTISKIFVLSWQIHTIQVDASWSSNWSLVSFAAFRGF